jgi:hypothetical protein
MKAWLLVLLLPVPALACTLWGAAGEDAAGGTILSKNRDWAPDHQQIFKRVVPGNGYAFAGLFAEGNKDPGIKAGINEKGLTIVSASSNVPKKLRNSLTGTHGVMRQILTDYASVDAIMADAAQLFARAKPNYYLISDRQKLLVVEVGLDGRFAIRSTSQGVLSHTNHYLDKSMPEFTEFKTGMSSSSRLARINELLATANRPLDPKVFLTFSRDQNAGPDNSLWRTGVRTRTLASWIIRTPGEGAPRLTLTIANPGTEEVTQEVVLDEAYWRR